MVELTANLICFGFYFTGTSVVNYPKGTDYTASVIRYMKEREENNLFYRAETTHSQTLNDGALNGYNGISAFTSSANVKTTLFMQALGYGAKNTYNRYLFEESSPVSNLFLGLKYMIERDGKDKTSTFFQEVNSFGDTVLLENQAYLPLGFLTQPELAQLNFDTSLNAFQFQNQLFQAATGLGGEVWHRIPGENLTITGNGATVQEENGNGYCRYTDTDGGSNVTYSYVADRDGFACIHLNLPKRNGLYVSVNENGNGYCRYTDTDGGSNVTYSYVADRDGFACIHLNLPKRNGLYVSVNGKELYYESMSLPQMLAVQDVRAGDVIDIRMVCGAGEDSSMTVSVSVNGKELYYESMSLPQMLAVQDVRAGDVIDIRMVCGAGEDSSMTVSAGILNGDLFWQGYEILGASTWNLTKFDSTHAEGIIDCNRDGLLYTSIPQNGNWQVFWQGYEILGASTWNLTKFDSTHAEGIIDCNRDGLLYTSIPQNGNWQVTVDGQPVETQLVGDCMAAVALTQGQHRVSFVYKNPAFSLGWKVSLLCGLMLLVLVQWQYHPDWKRLLPKKDKA